MAVYLFLADENVPLPSIWYLRNAGHDVASVSEDTPGVDDSMVLARARQQGRVLLTLDRDYGELIYRMQLPVPVGVVYFRFQPATPTEIAHRLLQVLSLSNIMLDHTFTIVSRSHVRQRPLP